MNHITISKEGHKYTFVQSTDPNLALRLYIPDHNPGNVTYELGYLETTGYIDSDTSLPCVPFMEGGEWYSEFIYIQDDRLVSINICKPGTRERDLSFTGGSTGCTTFATYQDDTPRVIYRLGDMNPFMIGDWDQLALDEMGAELNPLRDQPGNNPYLLGHWNISAYTIYIMKGSEAIAERYVNADNLSGTHYHIKNLIEKSGIPNTNEYYVIIAVQPVWCPDGGDNVRSPRVFYSNIIPVDEILWSSIHNTPISVTTKINIYAAKMKLVNIQKITNTSGGLADDTKNHLIHPVFFRVHPLGSIVVHPAVDENICINLDNYKSKVDSFNIKLGSVSFPEIGRTSSGVIFKIEGSMIGDLAVEGTYYVTDESGVMITSGKYQTEQ